MLSKILSIIFLGILGGFIPGPILTMGFSEGVRGGFKSGMRVAFWAIIAESLLAGIILILFSILPDNLLLYSIIGIVGGLFLLFLSVSILKTKTFSIESDNSLFTKNKIFLLTLFNGGLYIFWITVCVPLAIEFNNIVFLGKWLFLFLFEIGWFLAMLVVVLMSVAARKWINNPNRLKTFFYFIALFLAIFGLRMIYNGIIKII